MTKIPIRALVTLAVVAVASGCGKAPTGKVSGKVLYKGKAVANARINFVPTEGYPVAAVTDASGLYSVSGVRYGASKVTVDLLSEPLGAGNEPQGRNPKATPEEKEKARASQAARMKEEKDKPLAAKLPAKYRELGTTPLVYNVIGPDGTFDIELKD